MTRSLRRSRRAPKKNSEYNVGDIVEINRGGVVLQGRLAQLLTEGTSPNPRWLVKFDGQPQKDEEMYERSFGKLLATYEEEDPTPPVSSSPVSTSQRKGAKVNSNGNSRRGSGGKNSGTSSEGENGDEPKKGKVVNPKKTVQFAAEGSHAGSDNDSETSSRKSARDRVSAREERSRRRQAKIDTEMLPGEPMIGGKRKIPPPPPNTKKRQRTDDGAEVVKVKLLTGTLYLYRGKQRRAEFVRRV